MCHDLGVDALKNENGHCRIPARTGFPMYCVCYDSPSLGRTYSLCAAAIYYISGRKGTAARRLRAWQGNLLRLGQSIVVIYGRYRPLMVQYPPAVNYLTVSETFLYCFFAVSETFCLIGAPESNRKKVFSLAPRSYLSLFSGVYVLCS